MKPLGLAANAVGIALRVPANRVQEIVNRRRTVSADTALHLARYFGTTPEFRLNLQGRFDLETARAELGEAIERDVRPRAPDAPCRSGRAR